LKKRHYLTINAYWFGLAFMWNGLHPIILPALLLPAAGRQALVPEALKNTYLGGMTFVGLILAMIVQPLAGALSDRTRTRWGRRRPWMLAGTLLALVFLAVMAVAGNVWSSFWALAAAYFILQIASNSAHGPAQGLIPDLVPQDRRGLASGLKNLFDMAGLVVTSLVGGQLMADGNPVLAFGVTGAVLALATLVTLFDAPETPAPSAGQAPGEVPSRLRDLFRADWKAYPDYRRLLVSRYLILLGIYAVQNFAQYYIRDWLALPRPSEVTGNLMAAIGLALTALVFPAGWLSDRIGRRTLNVAAGGLAALGILLLAFARNLLGLYLFAGLIGAATGVFLSVNWAWATDLIPGEEAGKFLGLSNLATAGAGACSRLAGPLIDGINALWPGTHLGYPTTFVLASVLTLAGALAMLRIRESPSIRQGQVAPR